MSIYIHCHISQPIPDHLIDSIRSIHKTEPSAKVFLITDQDFQMDCVEVLKIKEIVSRQTSHVMRMKLFNKQQNPLWRTSIFRIFLVRDAMNHIGIKNCYHFDSDVLLFIPSSEFEKQLPEFEGMLITPCNSNEMVFGFSRFGSLNQTEVICSLMKRIIFNPFIRWLYYKDMPNEMQLIAGIAKKRPDLIRPLNTFPIENKFVFDPSSYGQYFGGTHTGHPEGFTDDKHDIGIKINKGIFSPIIKDNKPYVLYNEKEFPIVNLHIHSKKTDQFL
jgi:hypothetical protein